MDDFYHTEVTSSGNGSSHNTILTLLQNQKENYNSPTAVSKKPTGSTQNEKSLDKIVPCQELIKMGRFSGRGKIPDTFSPGDEFARQHRLWVLSQYKDKSPLNNGPHFKFFAAVKSLLYSSTHFVTKCGFTPILPYSATDYDAIFTTMINIQDVLKQKERENGPLWSDEGVNILQKKNTALISTKI